MARIIGEHSAVYCPHWETNAFLGRFQDLPELLIQAKGKHFVEKTPRHIYALDIIRRELPGSKFVLMVRDGRDAIPSMAKRVGNLTYGASRWMGDNQKVMSEVGADDTMLVRYEDLIENPAREAMRVCDFIGIEYESTMLEYHKRPFRWKNLEPDEHGTHEQRRAWQMTQPIFDGRGTGHDVPILQSREGRKLMEFFGYAQ